MNSFTGANSEISMSLKNHPNFHAAGYTTDILVAFYERLRGDADKKKINSDKVSELVRKFVSDVEEVVDESAK